jgi:hypothetical protein
MAVKRWEPQLRRSHVELGNEEVDDGVDGGVCGRVDPISSSRYRDNQPPDGVQGSRNRIDKRVISHIAGLISPILPETT